MSDPTPKTTDAMKERDKTLARLAFELAQAVPHLFGSVQFNLQGGVPVNVNVVESVRLQKGETK